MLKLRIRLSKETVKKLGSALQRAYKAGDVRMVRRVAALLDIGRGDPVETVAQRHGVGRSSVYAWLSALLVGGVASLQPRWKGGRPSKLTKRQKQQLIELVKAGPQAAGFPCGCWNAVMIQELIQREFGVLYNAHYVCELLKNLGFSFQKARFISDHLDEAQRLVWLTQSWPAFRERAQAAVGLIRHQRGSLELATVLMLIFIAVLSYGIYLGLDVDCGCFGPEDPESAAFHGLRRALYRDMALMVGIIFLYYRRHLGLKGAGRRNRAESRRKRCASEVS
jgi:transposase